MLSSVTVLNHPAPHQQLHTTLAVLLGFGMLFQL